MPQQVKRILMGFAAVLVPLAPVVACSRSGPATSSTATGPAATASGGASQVSLTLTGKGCDPANVAARSGQIQFKVKNASDEVAEVEVLSAGKVLKEVENIVMNAETSFDVTLGPGDYDLICVSDDKPKGTLKVS